MASLDNFSEVPQNDESDYDTICSDETESYNSDIEEEEEEEEPIFFDGEEEYYDDEYYVDNYEEVIEKKVYAKVNTEVPKVNPWGLNMEKRNEVKIKSMEEIVAEEIENKKKEDLIKMEKEKINQKRKDRFKKSRQSFHFRSNENQSKSLLLKGNLNKSNENQFKSSFIKK